MTTALYATDSEDLDLDDPALDIEDAEEEDYCACVERGDGTACHDCHERESYSDYYGDN